MQYSNSCPCKGCDDRQPGSCHSTCAKYKEWKEAFDSERDKVREAKEKYYSIPYHKAGLAGFRDKATGGLYHKGYNVYK